MFGENETNEAGDQLENDRSDCLEAYGDHRKAWCWRHDGQTVGDDCKCSLHSQSLDGRC